MRTCFFVVFGMSMNLRALIEIEVVLIGSIIVLLLYLIRYINFRVLIKSDVFPEIFLAPRGLITILLFYQIPVHYQITNFSVEILSFVIIVTSLIMSIAIIVTPKIKPYDLMIIDIGLAPVNRESTLDEEEENINKLY
jgi:hypothetical protein